VRSLLYQPRSGTYVDDTGAQYSQAQLQAFIQAGDIQSFMGVYPGTGAAAVSP
jgi:hypothetical protein